ncbi:hypothetical protein K443DRAFT_353781 [Laccaria amethystina LaAM-08-1]|uniref:Uncharacterized protein n=1 Tax=Laccaria amethystina LaAM-08-1 TaxID=1095629 RepID=A0A0C9YBH7_9AGAR|nr:hypothetical protein K443DRAFT_353781 [Laccaria amethystina LaAM-08-1]
MMHLGRLGHSPESTAPFITSPDKKARRCFQIPKAPKKTMRSPSKQDTHNTLDDDHLRRRQGERCVAMVVMLEWNQKMALFTVVDHAAHLRHFVPTFRSPKSQHS